MKMYNFLKNEQIDVLCPDRFIESGSIVNGPFIKFLIVRVVNYACTIWLMFKLKMVQMVLDFSLEK